MSNLIKWPSESCKDCEDRGCCKKVWHHLGDICKHCGMDERKHWRMNKFTREELWAMLESSHPVVLGWLERGDGCAVYENMELGNPNLGHKKFVSFGSSAAQLEVDIPPNRLPDMGNQINWRYTLIGVVR